MEKASCLFQSQEGVVVLRLNSHQKSVVVQLVQEELQNPGHWMMRFARLFAREMMVMAHLPPVRQQSWWHRQETEVHHLAELLANVSPKNATSKRT